MGVNALGQRKISDKNVSPFGLIALFHPIPQFIVKRREIGSAVVGQ